MPVLAIKTEVKCKLCASEHRPEIDLLLEQRSVQGGRKINTPAVLKQLEEWGVPNPTKENLTGHWKNHCEYVTQAQVKEQEEVKAEMESRALAMCEEEFGVGWQDRVLTNDEFLVLVRIASQNDIYIRLSRGEKTGATIDHGLKSVDGSTKRKSNEALDDWRKGVGQALQVFAEREIANRQRVELPPGEQEIIEDAEYERVEKSD